MVEVNKPLPGEAPTGERAKRLAEISEWLARHDDESIADLGHDDAICELERAALDIVPTLRDEVRDADAALTAAGIPDDGRTLTERIAALAKERDELRRDVARLSALKSAEVAPVLERFAAAMGVAPSLPAALRAEAEEDTENDGPEVEAAKTSLRLGGGYRYRSGSEAAGALGLPPPEPDLEPAVGDEPTVIETAEAFARDRLVLRDPT